MINLERAHPQITDDAVTAMEAARSLSRRVRTGEVDPGFAQVVESELKSRWYSDGYRLLMTFVDRDCNPIIISRLNKPYDEGKVCEDGDVRYRFFIDGATKDVTIPQQLVGEERPFHKDEDNTLYDLSNEDDFRAAIEDEEVADSLAWLYERLGRTLTVRRSDEDAESVPYIASDREVLGVRLDVFLSDTVVGKNFSRHLARS